MEESTRAILEKAIDLMKAGKREEAVPLVAGLLRKNPDLELGWFLLGMALESAHQRIRAFKEVLRINPNNQKAQEQLNLLTRSASSQEALPHVSPFIDKTSSPERIEPKPAPPPAQDTPTKAAPSARPVSPPSGSALPPQSASIPKTPAPRQPLAQSASAPPSQVSPTPARRMSDHPSASPQRRETPPPARKMPTTAAVPQRQGASAQVQSAPTHAYPPAKRMPTPYRKTRPAPAPPVVQRRDDSLERLWKRFLDMQMQMFGGVILLIGIGLAVLLVSSLAKDVPLWIFGKTADGTILEKTWSEFDYHDPDMENKDLAERLSLEMQYYFDYQFTTPSGETYVGHTEVTENEFNGYNNGNTIKVRYSTLNPNNSRLDDARLVPFLMCTYSIFIIITLFTLAAGRELVDF